MTSQPDRTIPHGAYLAVPPAGTGPGVLVLHAWWGLNPFIRAFCDRLAGAGLRALAPDLYHGATADTIEGAKKLRGKMKQETAHQEILQAAAFLHASSASAPAIAVAGFSLGGYYALWLAEQPEVPVAAAAIFYGSRGGDYSAGHSALQFHLAEKDPYVPASGVKSMQKALKKAGRDAELYSYPGTSHWFFESDRPDAYQAGAAGLAWDRLLAFLGRHLLQ
ncbi:MAG TPA: dienelactone hydrolase family protein [Anaerolineae bacterium]|nr:dienelactone hydrolase family protein [Anaerolineae bacterium]